MNRPEHLTNRLEAVMVAITRGSGDHSCLLDSAQRWLAAMEALQRESPGGETEVAIELWALDVGRLVLHPDPENYPDAALWDWGMLPPVLPLSVRILPDEGWA